VVPFHDHRFHRHGRRVGGNLNAPHAVTVAAVIYVLRTLVGTPIPLNSGCLELVDIHVPPGTILSPGPEKAVAGGNVETSQRVVDVLLGALGKAAASRIRIETPGGGGWGCAVSGLPTTHQPSPADRRQ
jgi:N-methylhydantoinase B/oxoprolinase/acetone carboxylase alpha subunit